MPPRSAELVLLVSKYWLSQHPVQVQLTAEARRCTSTVSAGSSAKLLMFCWTCTTVPFHLCGQHGIAGWWCTPASTTSAHTSAISLLWQHPILLRTHHHLQATPHCVCLALQLSYFKCCLLQQALPCCSQHFTSGVVHSFDGSQEELQQLLQLKNIAIGRPPPCWGVGPFGDGCGHLPQLQGIALGGSFYACK